MNTLNRVILLLTAILSLSKASGENRVAADSIDCVFYFRTESILLDPSFLHNDKALQRLDHLLDNLVLTPLDTIRIEAFASPAGPEEHNQRLSTLRASVIRAYLRTHYPRLRNASIRAIGGGSNHHHYRFPPHSSPTPNNSYLRYATLQLPKGGGCQVCRSDPSDSDLNARGDTTRHKLAWHTASPQSPETPESQPAQTAPLNADNAPAEQSHLEDKPSADQRHFKAHRRLDASPRFALKTNLLYWAALTPNLEFEYYFARRWSLNLEYQGAWWANRSAHKYLRIVAGGPEVRYWIAHRDHFRGHFVGAYVGMGAYEFMGRPSYGLQGEFYITGGISYGYDFRIGKRLRMEVSIGVGYMLTEYREYHWDNDCYVYDRTKRQTYFGPTKAKVSLIYPFGWGGRKGGIR